MLGCHYSLEQVCAWLNDAFTQQKTLTAEESALVGLLLQDGVLSVVNGRWQAGGHVRHVLAAAPGKKRDFAKNLRHERLHVYWDEDAAFRERETAAWAGLSEAERQKQRDRLKNYNQSNEQQLIEEWAVVRAENSNMPLN